MDTNNVKYLAEVLENCGKKIVERRFPDGTMLLAMPYGGRIIGLCTANNEQNFFWTNPALTSHNQAQLFFCKDQWHNSGGDRTWLAPELEIFFPQYPDLGVYQQPEELDPGHFRLCQQPDSLSFLTTFSVQLFRSRQVLQLSLQKTLTAADNPLPMAGVEYAGFTSATTLKILDAAPLNAGPVGLWNLMQMPCGGQMLIAARKKCNPFMVFGQASDHDFDVSDSLCRYNVTTDGSCKFSLQADEIAGRAGYVYAVEGQHVLAIRNFTVTPAASYIDVPFDRPELTGFAFQGCKINKTHWGSFCEVEYHAPAIGAGTGKVECRDVCQTWAFRGEQSKIENIAKSLFGL